MFACNLSKEDTLSLKMELPIRDCNRQGFESTEGRTGCAEAQHACCYRVAEAAIEFAWIRETRV